MHKSIVAALAAVLLALGGCTGPAASTTPTATAALPSTTIGLTYIPNVQFSPFYVAEAADSYTAAGVDATLRHHGASEGLFTALVAGQEQFVVAGADEMLQARSQGMDLIAVSSYYRSYPVVVIVPADSQITTLADLKGHSIGVPGRYGESWFGLQVALRTAGLAESDVQIKEIGYTQQAALRGGKVDAIIGFSNNDLVQSALSSFAVRSIPITSGDVPLVGASLITTTAYAKAHPEVVRSVVAGTLAGISSVVADQANALTVSGDYIPGLDVAATKLAAEATLTATLPLWTGSGTTIDGRLDSAQWAKMAEFMGANGLTATVQDPTLAMSNDYLG
jgi:ABC-type nitrate/sulfonate/bicarbonate transport systems, periplasmic components